MSSRTAGYTRQPRRAAKRIEQQVKIAPARAACVWTHCTSNRATHVAPRLCLFPSTSLLSPACHSSSSSSFSSFYPLSHTSGSAALIISNPSTEPQAARGNRPSCLSLCCTPVSSPNSSPLSIGLVPFICIVIALLLLESPW